MIDAVLDRSHETQLIEPHRAQAADHVADSTVHMVDCDE